MRTITFRLIVLLLSLCLLVGCTVETKSTGNSGTAVDGTQAATLPTLGPDDKPKLAFVTNGAANFWRVASVGAKKAGADFNADIEVFMPTQGAEDQKMILEDLITRKVDGVAVSPIHPENQAETLRSLGKATRYITHDSDAPETGRLVFVGVDNYVAGRLCGSAVKEVMPEGGDIMIFVGRLGQLNADLRRQGIIDELLDRDHDSTRRDLNKKAIKGDKYTILDTRTDDFDLGRAKGQAEDAIVAYPNLGCMIGLFDYNPPAILEAVRANNKAGKIKVVAFDERQETLTAVKSGECYATIVQDPYNYGYKSMEILAKLSRGDDSAVPESQFVDYPAKMIGQDEVEAFEKELNDRLAAAEEK